MVTDDSGPFAWNEESLYLYSVDKFLVEANIYHYG